MAQRNGDGSIAPLVATARRVAAQRMAARRRGQCSQRPPPPKHTASAATGSAPGRLITSYFSPQPASAQPAAADGEGGSSSPPTATDPSTSLLGALFSPLYTIFNGASADATEQAEDTSAAASAESGSSVTPEQTDPRAVEESASAASAESAEPVQAQTGCDDVPPSDREEPAADDQQEADEADYYEEFDPYFFIKSLPPLPADHAENVRALCLPSPLPTSGSARLRAYSCDSDYFT